MNLISKVDEIYNKLERNWQNLLSLNIDQELADCKYVCIFGTGDWFNYSVENYKPFIDGRLDFLCDNNEDKWGTVIHGVPCISPAELQKYSDDVFVFVAIKNPTAIFKQLTSLGITHMNIIHPWINQKYEMNVFESIEWKVEFKKSVLEALSILADDFSKETMLAILETRYSVPPEYENYANIMVTLGDDYFFDTPLGKVIDNNEYFVDIGAYTGDTLRSFIKRTKGQFAKVHCFELDKFNFEHLEEEASNQPTSIQSKICLYKHGLGHVNEIVYYKPGRETTSVITPVSDNDELVCGEVKVLDEVLCDQKVTIIKMDVEGMEAQVLKGARNIIRTQKPKMAISVYHKNSDIWKLPLLIHDMNPEYEFYLRHQACINASTILYCI